MIRKRRVLAALTLSIGLIAAACGGSSSGSSTDNTSGTVTDAVAIAGGSATVLQPVDAQSLDPTTVINSPSQGSATPSALYGDLFLVDPQTGAIIPGIATDFSTADGLTWTMKLRSGVTFTDGTPFNAAAVKAQWEKCQPNIRCSAYSHLTQVTSMTAVDDVTFQVVLNAVNYQFHQLVPWSSLTWIPSPTAVAAGGENYSAAPVGAGPFTLKSRTPNSETVLTKNPTYWQAGLPKLDTLTIKTVPDAQQAYDTVTQGQAEGTLSMSDNFAADATAAGYTAVGPVQVGGAAWLFGTKRAPFTDVRARKAVYLALDMEKLNQNLANGASTVPTGLFPEGSPFYDAATAAPGPNAEEAQQLFDDLAAEGNPVKFTIVNAGGASNQRAIEVQTQLSQFKNVTVDVKQLDGSTYGTTLYGGDFDLAIYGIGGSDPEPVLGTLKTDAAIPIASMKSAEIDAAIQQGREATDVAGRKAAYSKLNQLLNDQYRLLWMNINHQWSIISPKTTGLVNYGQGTSLWENYGFVG